MANIVLVHGAWHGGWCWRDTARALRAMGHTVFAPTHSGVGERFHQSGEAITLETHVRDVAGCIEAEELDDVVLCGHSYGGMVITCVADRMPERIGSMVYVDAFVPQDGESVMDLLPKALPPEVAQAFLAGFRDSARQGNSGLMQPIPAEMFGIKPENREWVERRCRPQAIATFEMPALLGKAGAGDAGAGASEASGAGAAATLEKLYIQATGWQPSPFEHFARTLEGQPGWRIERLAGSHDLMVDMPDELAGLIAQMA